MDGAYTAVSDDSYAILYNPAGLSLMDTREIALLHHMYLQGMNYDFLTYGEKNPLFYGYFGLGIGNLRMDPEPRTWEDAFGNYAGTSGNFQFAEYLLIASYSTRLIYFDEESPFFKNSSIGVACKGLFQQLDISKTYAAALDLGYLYELPNLQTRFGASLRNIGTPVLDSPMPLEWRIGVAQYALNKQVLVAVDSISQSDNTLRIRAGTELSLRLNGQQFSFRCGGGANADIQALDQANFGFGYYFPMGDLQCRLDYAYAPFTDLGTTNQFSLSLHWLPPENVVDITGPEKAWLPDPQVTFDTEVKITEPLSKWVIEIKNSAGELVRQFSGVGRVVPDHVIWDGRFDRDRPAEMGYYSYQLIVTDKKGNTIVSEKKILELLHAIVEEHEKRGIVIKLPSELLFASGSDVLSKEAPTILDEGVKILKEKYPDSHLLLEGHTDNTPILPGGKFRDNIGLSQARANTVAQYFFSKGIASDRVSTQGYGDTKPIASNDTPEGKLKNRRVEVVILSAQTNSLLSGAITQDTTWSPQYGPYVIDSDLLIASGATLTILPGTEIRVNETMGGEVTSSNTENTDISIRGRIIAVGTSDQPIVFEPGKGQSWGAIYFAKGSASDSKLSYCKITGGRIICQYSSPAISHCTIDYGGGIEVGHAANPTIENNIITSNQRALTFWFKDSSATVSNNKIANNRIGAFIQGFENITLKNNSFSENSLNLANHATAELDAGSNWWGSTDTNRIQALMEDAEKSTAFGKVKWQPNLDNEPKVGP